MHMQVEESEAGGGEEGEDEAGEQMKGRIEGEDEAEDGVQGMEGRKLSFY